jgi:hypothetical protein
MNILASKKLSSVTLVCCLVCVGIAARAWAAMSTTLQASVPEERVVAQVPAVTKVRVHPQPHVPLTMTVDNVSADDPRAPGITLSLENRSDRTVRAFAIRYEWHAGAAKGSGTKVSHRPMTRSGIAPGQTCTDSIGGFSVEIPIERVELFVDYVDFTDGNSWGDDLGGSAVVLAGERAGMRAVVEYARTALNKGGPESVREMLDSDLTELPSPVDKPERWLSGYRSGKQVMQSYLRRSEKVLRGGPEEVRRELDDKSAWSIWR